MSQKSGGKPHICARCGNLTYRSPADEQQHGDICIGCYRRGSNLNLLYGGELQPGDDSTAKRIILGIVIVVVLLIAIAYVGLLVLMG